MSESSAGRALVLYPPAMGYYVDREFPVLLPGYTSTYALADSRVAKQFRTAPSGFVYPEYRAVIPGLPGSPIANCWIPDLTDLIDTLRPSTVFTYECFSSLSNQVARSPRRSRFRHVVLCYETVTPRNSLWGWFPVTRLYARHSCRSADLFVAHSARAARALQAAGAPVARILIRPPGVYPSERRTSSPQDKSATGAGRVIYLGSLTQHKGVLTLADAAARLANERSSGSRLQFSVAGEGPLRAEVEHRTAALGPRFRLHGRIAEATKVTFLAEASVLVCPSQDVRFGPLTRWEEQTATAAMEAMVAGTPVIGSDSGALPEIIGEGGWTFPRGSSEALADRLTEMVDSPDSWEEARRCARVLGATRYDIFECARDVAARLRAMENP